MKSTVLTLSGVIVLVSGSALADPAPATPKAAEPTATSPGFHVHDGFYMRLGLGFTGLGDTMFSEAKTGDEPRDQSTVTGFGTASEIAFGGTIAPGFVLGGGIYGASALATTFERVRGTAPPEELQRPNNFAVIGVMADWYFNPRKGFHAQAALGAASLTGVYPEVQRYRDRSAAVGGGVMLGIGYEWWVSDNWGVGILGRVTGGVLVEEDSRGDRWFHLAAASPSMLFTATYH